MRGRTPTGPEAVEQLDGSDKAKKRLQLILETMMGQWRVEEVCARLEISTPRYRQLRQGLLQAALDSLAERPAGRPRQQSTSDEIVALRRQVAELERQLQVAQVREEIALALPQVHQPAPAATATPAPKKKRRR